MCGKHWIVRSKCKVIVTNPEVDRSIPEEGHFPVGLEILVLTHSCFLPLSLVVLWLISHVVSQRCIINNTHRLVELCVAKLSQDWFPLLELLAMATNPHCKFHIYNGTRPSETVPAGAQLADDELFARPPDPRSPKVSHHCNCNSWPSMYT